MKFTCCRLSICRVGLVMIGAAVCLGCSGESQKTKDRYVPPTELARDALEAVLADWQTGREPGPIDRLAVGVRVVDKQRKKGQSLDEYQILGEAPGETGRCFAVRVKLKGPEAEQKVRFVIIGIDPLWVFRQEDFELLTQWACTKEEEPATPPAASAQPDDGQQVPHDSVANVPGESSAAPATAEEAVGQPEESGARQNE
jgi:hypothetical protein